MAVPLTDPSVQGAEVSIFVPELGETFIGYTNNVGLLASVFQMEATLLQEIIRIKVP